MDSFEIVDQGQGEYRVRAGSFEGTTYFTLALRDADTLGDDRLSDDETTARATVRYLLARQDAGDLPARVEIGDVVAAYPDAVDGIEALRD